MILKLHIHQKYIFSAIFGIINIVFPNSIQNKLDAKCIERSPEDELLSVPPYDLSTPLNKWRYLGDKYGYEDYYRLDDIMILPGRYTPSMKWDLNLTYNSLSLDPSQDNINLVVSRDHGKTWTDIPTNHNTHTYTKTAQATFDEQSLDNGLHFGIRYPKHSASDLMIEHIAMEPSVTNHTTDAIATDDKVQEPNIKLENEYEQLFAQYNKDPEAFKAALNAYIDYIKDLSSSNELTMDNDAFDGMVDILKPSNIDFDRTSFVYEIEPQQSFSLGLSNHNDSDNKKNHLGLTLDTEGIQNKAELTLSDDVLIMSLDLNTTQHQQILHDHHKRMSNIYEANFTIQDTLTCQSLTEKYLTYSKTIALRFTESKVMTNFAYYGAYKKYKKNTQTLREGLNGLREEYSELIDNCNFTPGDTIEAPFLGEPTNLCVLGSVYYDLSLDSKKNKSDALAQAGNEVFYAGALLPKGNGTKIFNALNEKCLIPDKSNVEIQIYDIPIFENNLANYFFYDNKENNYIKKNLEQGKINYFDTISLTCSQALSKIDKQNQHWHSMISGIDSSYSLGSGRNMAGKPTYKIYSYRYESSHLIKEFKIFQTIMRMASLILSSNGYLNRNIETYKSQCVSNDDINPFFDETERASFNYVLKQRTTQINNIQTSLDNIVKNEFNNFKATRLLKDK